jgi:hypothetical protein
MNLRQGILSLAPTLLGITVSLLPTRAVNTWNTSLWSGVSWTQGPNSARWPGLAWDGNDWNGWTWTGRAWNDGAWAGSAWNGAAWNGSAWNSSAWN